MTECCYCPSGTLYQWEKPFCSTAVFLVSPETALKDCPCWHTKCHTKCGAWWTRQHQETNTAKEERHILRQKGSLDSKEEREKDRKRARFEDKQGNCRTWDNCNPNCRSLNVSLAGSLVPLVSEWRPGHCQAKQPDNERFSKQQTWRKDARCTVTEVSWRLTGGRTT